MKKNKKLMSIVVPCYNEEAVLPKFYETITDVLGSMEQIDWEIIFVDDGSKDQTLKIFRKYFYHHILKFHLHSRPESAINLA